MFIFHLFFVVGIIVVLVVFVGLIVVFVDWCFVHWCDVVVVVVVVVVFDLFVCSCGVWFFIFCGVFLGGGGHVDADLTVQCLFWRVKQPNAENVFLFNGPCSQEYQEYSVCEFGWLWLLDHSFCNNIGVSAVLLKLQKQHF